MEIKCIHTGDIHLGMEFKNASFDKEQAYNRRIELWETFNRIIDRAKKKEVDLLLIAGDLFEDKYCTIGDVKRISDRFRDIKGTKVVIAAGNHDPCSNKSLYRLIEWSDNVHIFDSNTVQKIEFQDINTVVWGLSWDKKEEKESLLDNLEVENDEKINILLVHGDLLNDRSNYLPISKEKLINSRFDYIALGHIHKPQFIDDNIAYCGSPEPLDFGEPGDHGIIEGVISKEKIKMTFTSLRKREFVIKSLELNESMSFNDIIDLVSNCDEEKNRRKNLYRIVLKGVRDSDINIDLQELKNILNDKFYYIELIDKSKPDYDIDKILKDNKGNIIGCFIEEMKKKGLDDPIVKEALYYGLEELFKEKVIK
ncbi:metallophosphoesterase family protein [Thermohalobacter berrensis]|uniref:Exonuclease SbcD n=1 Tax=Thermohalobacter berrensis TaxID=99594 RepID=A0A419SZH9_9FIRM|nr:DNA repair exonuclease [Thermohalobacter berrensis]RKD30636.1 exonuclease SbcD [Thermohalobacter berrensis]